MSRPRVQLRARVSAANPAQSIRPSNRVNGAPRAVARRPLRQAEAGIMEWSPRFDLAPRHGTPPSEAPMALTESQIAEQKKQAEELLFSGPERLGFAKSLFFGKFPGDQLWPAAELRSDEKK